MSEFVYLFRGGDTPGPPAQMQLQMQKWIAWMKELGEKGHIKDRGNPLERSGQVVSGKQKTKDGYYGEAKDLVSGYMLLQAKDLDHAVKLSSGCPILETGGAVEVRPIMKMNT